MSNLNSYKDTFKEALGLDTKIELEKLGITNSRMGFNWTHDIGFLFGRKI